MPVCARQTMLSIGQRKNVCGPRGDSDFDRAHTANMEERNYLRQWREYRRLKQEELAELVGTTKAVISLLENEKRPLSSKWLRKLAVPLKTTPGRILDIDPNEAEAEALSIFDHMEEQDRTRAVRILRSLTGTGD